MIGFLWQTLLGLLEIDALAVMVMPRISSRLVHFYRSFLVRRCITHFETFSVNSRMAFVGAIAIDAAGKLDQV